MIPDLAGRAVGSVIVAAFLMSDVSVAATLTSPRRTSQTVSSPYISPSGSMMNSTRAPSGSCV
jgi:hypothetical protein